MFSKGISDVRFARARVSYRGSFVQPNKVVRVLLSVHRRESSKKKKRRRAAFSRTLQPSGVGLKTRRQYASFLHQRS